MADVLIPVVSVRQPIGDFFVGVVRADDLLRICRFDYRRMHFTSGYIDFMGIQRRLDEKRIANISKYLDTVDACFPTSIVISVDEKCALLEETERVGLKLLRVFAYVDQESKKLSIPLDEVGTIIDGQHRLKALEDSKKLDFEVSVSIFIGADDATEATLFSTVNLAQTKVNKSLVYDLFAIAKERSPERTCH
jgi:DGQHR domain-containing protein